MAIFKNSTFGNIRKSIGDDVAYRMGGQNVVRKKPAYVNDPKTEAQQKQRNALAVIVQLFRQNSAKIKKAFVERLSKHSAYNVFSSVNLKNAMSFAGVVASVNFDNLLVSKGSLPIPVIGNFADDGDGTGSFVVTNQRDGNLLFDADKIVLQTISKTSGVMGATSETQLDGAMPNGIDTNGFPAGETIAIYAYHKSANGSKTSDSIYLGTVVAD